MRAVEAENPLDCYMLPGFIARARAAAADQGIPVRQDVQDDTTFDAKLQRSGPAAEVQQVLAGLLDGASPEVCSKVRDEEQQL